MERTRETVFLKKIIVSSFYFDTTLVVVMVVTATPAVAVWKGSTIACSEWVFECIKYKNGYERFWVRVPVNVNIKYEKKIERNHNDVHTFQVRECARAREDTQTDWLGERERESEKTFWNVEDGSGGATRKIEARMGRKTINTKRYHRLHGYICYRRWHVDRVIKSTARERTNERERTGHSCSCHAVADVSNITRHVQFHINW